MKKKVLFVDDSLSIREIVKYTLEIEGYEVLLGNNGKHALDYLNGQNIDVIITDLHMPEMDGIEFIKKIRKIPVYMHTPILFLTTESQINKIMEAKAAGATGWITKPFLPARLIETIRKIIT
ncbi:MAG: response regulator [Bacteroidales bacterium]|nr:response regulator [Bacteroidales bacterium]